MREIRISNNLEIQNLTINPDFISIKESTRSEVCSIRPENALDARALVCERAQIGGNFAIRNSTVCGVTILYNAHIGGQLIISQTKLRNRNAVAVYADGLTIMSDFLLRDGVDVVGQFCMVNASIKGEMDFRDSTFRVLPNSSYVSLHPDSGGEALTLYRIKIGGSLRFGEKQERSSDTKQALKYTIKGCVNLQGAHIGGLLSINDAKINNKAYCVNYKAYCANDKAACKRDEPWLILNSAVIERVLTIKAITAYGSIQLAGAEIKSNVLFENVNLITSSGAIAIFAVRSHFHGYFQIGQKFSDDCATQGNWSTIEGSVDLSGCHFDSVVNFSAIKLIAGSTEISETSKSQSKRFTSLLMDDARIRRRLCLGGDDQTGSFQNGPSVRATYDGTVSLVGIHVEGDVICTGASFRAFDESDLNKSKFRDKENSVNCVAIDLTRTRIDGTLFWRAKNDNTDARAKAVNLDIFSRLRKQVIGLVSLLFSILLEYSPVDSGRSECSHQCRPKGEVILTQAKLGLLADDIKCWPEAQKLRIEGFDYLALHPLTKDINTAQRLEWLETQEKHSQNFSLQPYEHLVSVYRRMGTFEPIAEVAIRKQLAIIRGFTPNADPKDLTNEAWYRNPRLTISSFMSITWGVFLVLTCAYGYKPYKAAIFLALLIGISWHVFCINRQDFIPINSWEYINPVVEGLSVELHNDARTKDKRLPLAETRKAEDMSWADIRNVYGPFNAFLYSVDLALPIVELGKSHYWEISADHPVVEMVVVLDIILGHLLIILIALSPTTLLRKD